jgi:hypothetical protein
MSAPFDTLQLARGFEAAGFSLDQASKMAEAVAQALEEMELRLTNRISWWGALVVIVAGLAALPVIARLFATRTTSRRLMAPRLSTGIATTPARTPCLDKDRIAADCTRRYCDELALRQATRACSAFGSGSSG